MLSVTALLAVSAPPGTMAQDAGAGPDSVIDVIQAPENLSGIPDTVAGIPADVPMEDTLMTFAPDAVPHQVPQRAMGTPVVVELFTAQGCSTCPEADRLIAALAESPGVLALSWHVDYWDYLGWADQFADPAYTVRQQSYAAAAGERGVYTPQIVVDGQDTLIGVGRAALLALIDEHASRPAAVMVSSSRAGNGFVIELTPRAAVPGGVEVLLVRYLPQRKVTIEGGENVGHTVVYRNIVVGVSVLADWPARTPLRLTVRPGDPATAGRDYPDDTRHAVLIQQQVRGRRPGPILAAMQLD